MRKLVAVGVAVFAVVLSPLTWGSSALAKPAQPNGQITFERFDQIAEDAVIAVVNPDGSNLTTVSPPVPLGAPHWSPDGTRIAAQTPGLDRIASYIIRVATGKVVTLPMPEGLSMGCYVWSPDAERLACESYNEDDPSLNGIYTIRASDGSGVRRVTSIPGGDDILGSYSPNGKRLEFARFNADSEPLGLFVTKVNGTGLRRITPLGALIDGDRFGDWSPQGNDIVFAQHNNADVRNSIWVVHANGSGLHEIHFDSPIPCGGPRDDPTSRGCFDATWSPDGKQIAFIVNEPATTGERVFTANVDGSHLTQVTDGDSEYPDWGTRPSS